MKLIKHVKLIIASSKKRKMIDDLVNHQRTIIQSTQLAPLIAYKYATYQWMWGGDKGKEVPCEQKDFEKDIVQKLGPTYFKKAYRMRTESFYRLFSILKKDLDKEFNKSNNSAFEKRRKKATYYIDLKIRLSAAIRFRRWRSAWYNAESWNKPFISLFKRLGSSWLHK